MDYAKALEVLGELTRFGINLGLERIRSLLARFDNPQDALPVIHIGGTNGKGSTLALLSAALRQAGYRVGTFTSPHLVSYTERMAINGEPVSAEEFASLLYTVKPFFREVQKETGENPTEFEVLTTMAFLYFLRSRADLVLLEVGLGGDIDSTNVVKSPLLSIITNVSLDHTDYLGDTVEQIAEKKGGIIKERRPVITASSDGRALAVLRRQARDKAAPLFEVHREINWRLKEENLEGQHFCVNSSKNSFPDLFIPLKGEHQLVNAATALLALEVLNELGWSVTKEEIKGGLSSVTWPGRLEIVRKNPLVVIDGAHNPAGMEAVSRWLEKNRPGAGKVILVIGMLADKDRRKAAACLDGLVDMVVVTRPLSSRAGDWKEMAAFFRKEAEKIKIIEPLPEAISAALGQAAPGDLVLVTGSLYLIGEVRRLLTAE
ncbi:MAG: folylpolyglutamate synthase/dihydrofolate synthase family protein [Peptococcaceae bacterium]|jgi:dihydrofolate synthase/folylpolyglutamate synthase|nr:bifunctional folylpolyglutamate synthase/dihydrofolate synthase [Peptococcaceae bacterium]MDH7524230.1 folylpolyglutamate synthase/dihydrofolate synthase family protein [Peptococcaceae bacterium]